MAKLTDYHREVIVRLYAQYNKNNAVLKIMKEEFDLDLSLNQVRYYNPEDNFMRKDLHQKWVDIFEEERKQYRDMVTKIPISSKVYRLQRLQDQIDYMDKTSDLELGIKPTTRIAIMTTLIEEAEKMMGEYFSKIPTDGELEMKKLKQGGTIIQEFNQQVIHYQAQIEEKKAKIGAN